MFVWLETGPYPVQFGLALTKESFEAALEEYDLDNSPLDWPEEDCAAAWQWTPKGAQPIYMIGLNPDRQPTLSQLFGVIAHEVTHVVQFLWRDMGEEKPGDEAEAYITQWFVEQIVDLIVPISRQEAA